MLMTHFHHKLTTGSTRDFRIWITDIFTPNETHPTISHQNINNMVLSLKLENLYVSMSHHWH